MMMKMIRSLAIAVAIVATLATLASPARAAFVTVNSFSDIILWAGSGANEAGFVLQFGGIEDPTSIAWGYRWDGSASAQDMAFAIAGSITGIAPTPPAGLDSRLVVDASEFDFGGGPVVFVNTITYDQVGLPSEWSQVTRTIEDDFVNTGTYAAFYLNASAGGMWTGATMDFDASGLGITDTMLTDGGWYGFVQSDGSGPFAFTQPVAAVPEPSTWLLLAVGGMTALALRRRLARVG